MSLITPKNPPFQIHGANCGGVENFGAFEPKKTFEEMRQHPRLNVTMTVKYQMSLLESEKSWDGEGTLKNISFGGAYFTSNESLPLKPGQIRNFSINVMAPGDRLQQASSLQARGIVVRVQRPAPDNAALGIAVKFLTPLQLAPV